MASSRWGGGRRWPTSRFDQAVPSSVLPRWQHKARETIEAPMKRRHDRTVESRDISRRIRAAPLPKRLPPGRRSLVAPRCPYGTTSHAFHDAEVAFGAGAERLERLLVSLAFVSRPGDV